MENNIVNLLAFIIAMAIVSLFSVPFWMFGGAKWGWSALSVIWAIFILRYIITRKSK